MKKYRVTLTSDEREQLTGLIAAGKAAAQKLTHARILLKADQLVSRTILALLCVGGLIFSGLTLLGRYSPDMTYRRGVPEITWWSLACTGFMLIILMLLGTGRTSKREK